jgi:hypothetical protein
MSNSKKNSMQTTVIAQRRRLAVILILITDIGIIAWGAMAALLPEHLLGPGSAPILKAEFESYTSASWSTLSGTPAIAEFITILFRMYGTFNVVFGLMAVAITVTAFRRGDRWAWWALLVGNTIALGSAIAFDRIVNAIGIFEMSEYLGLLMVYVALAITAPFIATGPRVQSSAVLNRDAGTIA